MKFAIAALALATTPFAAHAQDVTTKSEVFVERTVTDAAGKTKIVIEEAKVVVPGTPLLIRISYKNNNPTQPVVNYRIVNPIPGAVSFVSTASADATVSVDGGATWGALAALSVKAADGTTRPAVPADVTDIQFALKQAIPVGGKGEVSFKGVVK